MYHDGQKKVSINDFDKKLAEVDAYLQLLIEQTEKLDKKIELANGDEERDGLIIIKNNTDNLLSSIKHAIVLLQIAKVTIKALPPRLSLLNQSPTTPTSSSSVVNHQYNHHHSSVSTSSQSDSFSPVVFNDVSPNASSVIQAPLRKKDKRKLARSAETSSSSSKFSPQSSTDSTRNNTTDTLTQTAGNIANNNKQKQQQQQQQQQPQARHSLSSELNNPNINSVAVPSSLSFKEQLQSNNSNNYYQPQTLHNEQQIVYAGDDYNDGDDDDNNDDDGDDGNGDDDDDEPFYDAADDDTPPVIATTTTTTSEIALQGRFSNLTLNSNQPTKLNSFIDTIGNCSNVNDVNTITTILTTNFSVNTTNHDGACVIQNNQSNTEGQLQQIITSSIPQTPSSIEGSNMEGSIDWESLYDEEEEDLGSLENHGSVIKHLISQIRIGMDLTKVVLPTFILERRSLLEMYADFFAHPDLFSSIPDYKTPEERMVQVVRWYLSAFHAGRKSSVAKKPYNPILGEIFRCHWALQEPTDQNLDSTNGKINQTSNTTDNYLKQGEPSNCDIYEEFPPSLAKDSLVFVAEQVSHHPPVSAFYVENRAKRITCCVHIYTKSKFLGLSVGVSHIGQGTIDLLDHNETYTCTFPSAFGRSILTVPWVELGGSVSIKCAQTQYSANIEFVTKPFYGGKKHRVLGEILRPNNEPFMTIDGEWNGIMYSKSLAAGEKELFVDTSSLPVIKKHVRPISIQETFESRNVWKEVTRALKLHDVANATEAKSFIEQKQRESLKERQEKGIRWETKYFEMSDDGWKYMKSLESKHELTNNQ